MQRSIFVGSSSEGLEKARHICEVLSNNDDVKCRLWTEIFEPGYLTFEALEQMLHQCCAAVFIASPDDMVNIRNRSVKAPRANILLEFGLVAGRFGRHSVAVCQYGGAELPSDLAGLTVIRMDPLEGDLNPDLFRQNAEKSLRVWSSRLVATAEGIARTDIVHGYTGRWDFDLSLQKWRDLPVINPGYVQVKGYLDLLLPASGQAGRGLAHGRLQFKVLAGGSGKGFYHGEYRTAHEVVDAVCSKDGTLDLTTEAFAVQRIQAMGTPPTELAEMDLLPEPWSARWKLSPVVEARALKGTVRTEGGIVSEGTVKAVKHSEFF
jgi:Predicted nucleotide-binding protein containing TIR-like domain